MKGSCLCGSVVYEIEPPIKAFQYCHCSRCRKSTGSAHAANLFVASAQFRWLEGEAQIAHFELPDAKYFSTRFCKRCGSSLPWEVKGGLGIVVPAGTLDEDPGIRPQQSIFWDSRAPWFVDTGALPKHEALPSKK